MTPPWFWSMWLILGLGLCCTGAGAWLTGRRARLARLEPVSRERLYCPACGERGEPDARFCGACGCAMRARSERRA